MRQRVMIAMALACSPELIIADEPTTALDVTIQAQIVELMKRLQAELGTAVIWISHDLGVVARLADRVAVMYAGHIVEKARVDELYARPAHPYTFGLLNSLPRLDSKVRTQARRRSKGLPPNLIGHAARVPVRAALRIRDGPVPRQRIRRLRKSSASHAVACWNHHARDEGTTRAEHGAGLSVNAS